ncbi:hypothetical protein [Streptomyces halobius]|uniref:Uncharacterized protein n=1 Tax=Streptomyces halobius TaxID=2879846 RepID=A0ABY4M6X1_9ACTN|nr:hypothetical protein [Streptomyces halobius]UQA93507.1 hypothetical protein K9S39_18090 [Streptomyces halobius]
MILQQSLRDLETAYSNSTRRRRTLALRGEGRRSTQEVHAARELRTLRGPRYRVRVDTARYGKVIFLAVAGTNNGFTSEAKDHAWVKWHFTGSSKDRWAA